MAKIYMELSMLGMALTHLNIDDHGISVETGSGRNVGMMRENRNRWARHA